MLIDDVVSYCDNEYRNHVCEHCSNEILCEYATDMGYSKVTACLKRNIKNGIKYNVL